MSQIPATLVVLLLVGSLLNYQTEACTARFKDAFSMKADEKTSNKVFVYGDADDATMEKNNARALENLRNLQSSMDQPSGARREYKKGQNAVIDRQMEDMDEMRLRMAGKK